MQCPTVQIQIEPSESNPSGVVVINESDYDPETMKLVSGEPPAPPVDATASTTAPSETATAVTPPWGSK